MFSFAANAEGQSEQDAVAIPPEDVTPEPHAPSVRLEHTAELGGPAISAPAAAAGWSPHLNESDSASGERPPAVGAPLFKTQRDFFRDSLVARMKLLSGDALESKVQELTTAVQSLRSPPPTGTLQYTLWQLWQIAAQAEANARAAHYDRATEQRVFPSTNRESSGLELLVGELEVATHAANRGDTSENLEKALAECMRRLAPTSMSDAQQPGDAALFASNSALSSRLDAALAAAARVFVHRDLAMAEKNGTVLHEWLRTCAGESSLAEVQAALSSARSWRENFSTLSAAEGPTPAMLALNSELVAAELRAEERALELTLEASVKNGDGLVRKHVRAHRELLTRCLNSERAAEQSQQRLLLAEQRISIQQQDIARLKAHLQRGMDGQLALSFEELPLDLSPSSQPPPSMPWASPQQDHAAMADGQALLAGIRSTIEQQISNSIASNADPLSSSHRIGCKITGVSVGAFAFAFPNARANGLSIAVGGERFIAGSAAQLEGTVRIQLDQGGSVSMSGTAALFRRGRPAASRLNLGAPSAGPITMCL